jgi:hypothetical protein
MVRVFLRPFIRYFHLESSIKFSINCSFRLKKLISSYEKNYVTAMAIKGAVGEITYSTALYII